VAETCQLAVRRIEHVRAAAAAAAAGPADESPYYSVDPTPALPASTPLEELRAALLDEGRPMFERYGALFALRNKGGAHAVAAMGEAFRARSALLKHEVAYVLGQMCDARSVGILMAVLRDGGEHPMVRHEAAEALGAVASSECVALLREFAGDAEPIVADSCLVALDMLAHEQSGAFEYADVGGAGAAAAGVAC
jgi:deoxyhypusine monooxygenase